MARAEATPPFLLDRRPDFVGLLPPHDSYFAPRGLAPFALKAKSKAPRLAQHVLEEGGTDETKQTLFYWSAKAEETEGLAGHLPADPTNQFLIFQNLALVLGLGRDCGLPLNRARCFALRLS